MAPPARVERALTSSSVKTTCGPIMVTAAQRALVMLVLCTDFRLLLWNTLAKGLWPVAPWCRRYVTRCLMAATSHALGCAVVPWPIDFPLTLFF